jgi:hypothetical protein
MPKLSIQHARVAIEAARAANVNTLAPDEFLRAEAYLRIALQEHSMKNSLLAESYARLAIEQVDAAQRIANYRPPSQAQP